MCQKKYDLVLARAFRLLTLFMVPQMTFHPVWPSTTDLFFQKKGEIDRRHSSPAQVLSSHSEHKVPNHNEHKAEKSPQKGIVITLIMYYL